MAPRMAALSAGWMEIRPALVGVGGPRVGDARADRHERSATVRARKSKPRTTCGSYGGGSEARTPPSGPPRSSTEAASANQPA